MSHMEEKRMETYEAPAALVVELKTEGIICESNGGGMPGGIPGQNF